MPEGALATIQDRVAHLLPLFIARLKPVRPARPFLIPSRDACVYLCLGLALALAVVVAGEGVDLALGRWGELGVSVGRELVVTRDEDVP